MSHRTIQQIQARDRKLKPGLPLVTKAEQQANRVRLDDAWRTFIATQRKLRGNPNWYPR